MADNTSGSALSSDQLTLLQSLGIDPNALLSGTGTTASTTPLSGDSLLSALQGSAMDVTGRYGLTGSAYSSSALPSWAQGLSDQVYSSPDFDPYYGSVSQSGDERVYMGTEKTTDVSRTGNKFSVEMGAPAPTSTVTTESGDKTITALQASNMPYSWDEDEVSSAIKKMQSAGLLDSTATFDDLVQAWGTLVNRAAQTYDASEGKTKVTPWDVLDLYKNEAQSSGLLDKLNGSKTTVSRNVTDVDEGEAWSTLQGTLSDLLGRDPTDQETRDFTYRMGQLAARNPSISKTVTQYKDGDAVSSSTHTDPGFTSSDMAQQAYDQAQSDPNYAEYRAGAFYFNALQNALGPVGGD